MSSAITVFLFTSSLNTAFTITATKIILVKQVQIAESLGVSYRHVETVINDFVQKQYLSKQKLIYTITDQEALASLAKELNSEDMIGNL